MANKNKGPLSAAEGWAAEAAKYVEDNKDIVESSEALGHYLPITGTYYGAKDAYNNVKEGNYKQAAIDAGIGLAATALPGLAGPLAKGVNKIAPDVVGVARGLAHGDKDFLTGWKSPSSTQGVGAQVIKGGNKKANDARSAYMQQARQMLKQDSGDDYDVMFHSSRGRGIDADNFQYRPVEIQGKGSYGKGPGVFTHGYDQDYDDVFGDNVYAVVYNKNKPTYSGKMDTTSGIDETFIPQSSVGEMVKIWGQGKPVQFNTGGSVMSNDWANMVVQYMQNLNTGGTVAPRLLPQVAEQLLQGYNEGGSTSPYKGLKKGAFTSDANSRGMTPAQFQAKVLSNPSAYSEVIRKRAQWRKNFAG